MTSKKSIISKLNIKMDVFSKKLHTVRVFQYSDTDLLILITLLP